MIETTTTSFGVFSFYSNDSIGRTIASGEFWDRHLQKVMDSMQPSGIFIDVGANIGFFTVYMAGRGAHVHAFEASPEIFALLKMNVAQNGLEHLVTCHNVPLYSSDGVPLGINPAWTDYASHFEDGRVNYDATENSGGLSLLPAKACGPYHFSSRTLDSFELRDVDLIKIDVQGCDFRVILGAEKTLDRCRPSVIWETETEAAKLHGDSLDSATAFFEGKEFDVATLRIGDGMCDSLASPRWRVR